MSAIRKALLFYMIGRVFDIPNISGVFFLMHDIQYKGQSLSFQVQSHSKLYGKYTIADRDWYLEWFVVRPSSRENWKGEMKPLILDPKMHCFPSTTNGVSAALYASFDGIIQ